MDLLRRRFVQATCALGSAQLLPSWAADAPAQTLRLAYSDSYGPFSWRTADGGAAGLLVDAMELLGRAGGWAVECRSYPWVRAQALVEMGEADGFCTLATKVRQAYALFTQEPLVSVPLGVNHRMDDARPAEIRSIEDMRQFRQGNYRGNGFARDTLEVDRLQWDNDAQSVLRRIAMGNLDIMVEGELVTHARLREYGLEKQVRFTPLPFLANAEYRFGLRRSYPDAAEVVKRMDTLVRAARRSGTLDALQRKYR